MFELEHNNSSGTELFQPETEFGQGLAVVSQDGKILYCNRRFADFANTPPEQITGASIADMVQKPDPPSDCLKTRDFLQTLWPVQRRAPKIVQIRPFGPHPAHQR
ncbi:MAG: PAS domain-containing protein [Desulfobacterales bacterium]|nr:PAS domain-containing protein [Desulfobacterales bacterium]